ncbi:gliding motility-associated C-terminal domain-containing protein, partial [Rufibacter roseus]
VSVSVGANTVIDRADNPNTASNVVSRMFDATRPAVALTTPAANSTNAPFTVTFTFSEPVSGFTVGEVTLTNASASDFTKVSGSVYTALITPAAQGEVTVSVPANVAQDGAGNQSTASAELNRIFDSIAPAGYGIAFVQTMVDFNNQTAVTLKVTGAEAGADYHYSITSAGGGTPVTGGAAAPGAAFDITGINVSDLGDGQLTVTFFQTDAATNRGADVTAQVMKYTRDIMAITPPATLRPAIRTTFAQLPLPTTVEVTYTDNSREFIPVTWAEGNYNGLVAGSYELSGTLTLSSGTTNLNNMVPKIAVEVQPNKAPTDIVLSKSAFKPNIGPDEAIGTFNTTDEDDPINGEPENQHMYELVSGTGSADNGLFVIDGNQLFLKSNRGLSGRTSFSIRVRTIDPYGNTFEKSFNLTKEGYSAERIKLVNAFTPNGDGVNDTWEVPELRFYNNVEVQVFDRSGVRLFHTTNPEQGWDGRNQHGQVVSGAYLYIIEVKDKGLVQKGTVTVLKK